MKSIYEAVSEIVSVYLCEEEDFSIHDITVAIRDLVKRGILKIYNLPDHEEFGQFISHEEVKSVFTYMMDEGMLDCVPKTFGKYTTFGSFSSLV